MLTGRLDPAVLDDDLAAPYLLDSEVANALRSLIRRGVLDEAAATAALEGSVALQIERFPVHRLLPRIWELRHTMTAYDATYVALAEEINADALLTTDARLARAPGARCPITLL